MGGRGGGGESTRTEAASSGRILRWTRSPPFPAN
uniref:Uncharacterized protein n=1 Tax=Arundo donax TaxID=35708 RepID=A0A0A8Y5L0_ARUDO